MSKVGPEGLTYYGGKKRLASWIVSLMPPHRVYTEAFAGGLAVFFRKERAKFEVINDKDERLVNAYQVLQQDDLARDLIARLYLTPYSRSQMVRARGLLRDPEASRVEKAWACLTELGQTINTRFGSGFRRTTARGGVVQPRTWLTHIDNIALGAERLALAEIECRDALDVIACYDVPDALHYCDPPYPGSDQGHYRGFTLDDFTRLWQLLSAVQGCAMLSCYQGTVDQAGLSTEGWKLYTREVTISAGRHQTKRVTDDARTEALWVKPAGSITNETDLMKLTKTQGRLF